MPQLPAEPHRAYRAGCGQLVECLLELGRLLDHGGGLVLGRALACFSLHERRTGALVGGALGLNSAFGTFGQLPVFGKFAGQFLDALSQLR